MKSLFKFCTFQKQAIFKPQNKPARIVPKSNDTMQRCAETLFVGEGGAGILTIEYRSDDVIKFVFRVFIF